MEEFSTKKLWIEKSYLHGIVRYSRYLPSGLKHEFKIKVFLKIEREHDRLSLGSYKQWFFLYVND